MEWKAAALAFTILLLLMYLPLAGPVSSRLHGWGLYAYYTLDALAALIAAWVYRWGGRS